MAGLNLNEFQQKHKKTQQVSREKTNLLTREIRLFPKRLSDKKKEAFYLELGTMLTAGLDLRSVLELFVEGQNSQFDRDLFNQIQQRVIHGAAFSEALRQSENFTPYEFFSVQIGEETGNLSLVLLQLADFYSRKIKQKQQFISAMSYPTVVLLTSLAAVTFMLSFIVPMFSDVFKRFGGELPYLTQLIVRLSNFLTGNAWLLLLTNISLLVGIFFLSKTNTFKRNGAVWLVRLPVVGQLVKGIYLARFCSSMALLMAAKVPILNAIALVKQMVSFYPIAKPLEEVEKGILKGESLYFNLRRYPIFDRKMIALLKVGEEVNQLDVFFDKLSKGYTEEVEQRTVLLNTFLEPVMIIFLGLIIGFILIAMYLPMFQLSTGINS
jgi:type IV pilus assembly protein PilC